MASTEQRYNDNVNWAKGTVSNVQNNDRYKNFEVSQLCSDKACINQIKNPEQTRYRNDSKQMELDSVSKLAIDDQGKIITDNFNKGRPSIDPNDPIYSRAIGYIDDAYTITHGGVSKYHDCKTGQSCDYKLAEKQCSRPTDTPYDCDLTPYVSSSKTTSHSKTFYPSPTGTGFSITLPDEGIVTRIDLPQTLTDKWWVDPTANVNGKHISNLRSKKLGTGCVSGSIKYCETKTYPKTLNLRIRAKTLNIKIIFKNKGNYDAFGPREIKGGVKVYWSVTKHTMAWQSSCTNHLPECKKINQTCTEPGGTKWISGEKVYLPCWKYSDKYLCEFEDTCNVLNECTEISTACEMSQYGVCVKNKIKKSCEIKTCVDSSLVCGETSFCLDGDCYLPDATQNTEFNQAASNLAAVSEAGKGLGDPPLIFTGQVQRCSKKPVGFSDCCKDGGWGTDTGLAQCSDEEKGLAKAKEKKLTIDLGEYCAEKVLGVCIRKKKSYCVFENKLARIIQEQGRPQIGLDFGSAKHPDCGAITPEQMQKMNFSKIDFGEFYKDLNSNTAIPDPNQIQKRLKESMQEKK